MVALLSWRGGVAAADAAEPDPAPAQLAPSFAAAAAQLEAARLELAGQLAEAATPAARAAVLTRAGEQWHQALSGPLLTDWVGTPWGRGAIADARAPRQPGRAVHCASFVIAALRAVGLRFVDGDRLAQAPALRILEALAPEGVVRLVGGQRRVVSSLRRLGDGVYLLGLPRHIGFAIVEGEEVRLVHASERAGYVVAEPASASVALRGRSAVAFVVRLSRVAALRRSRLEAALELGAASLLERWLSGAELGPR